MTLQDLEQTEPWEWPRDAGRKLLDVLRDRSIPAGDRALAAELAGNLVIMNDEMAGALLVIVRNADEPEEVRARAAISLGPVLEAADTEEIGEGDWGAPITEDMFEEIRDRLHRAYADTNAPKEVRRRILEASVRAPQDWHAEAVREAYSSPDEDWRLTAAFCMRFVPGFNDEILTLLDSRNAEIRYEVVLAAGGREIEAAWPQVLALLDPPTSDRRLLLAAIEASATIKPKEALSVLAVFVDSEDEEIAEAADDAVAMAEGYLEMSGE